MPLASCEHWPLERVPHTHRVITHRNLLTATEKYVQQEQLDCTNSVGNAVPANLHFGLCGVKQQPSNVLMLHGIGTYATPAIFLSQVHSDSILKSLHPADRLCALRMLAWDYIRRLFQERYPDEAAMLPDDDRVLYLFHSQRHLLQPLLSEIEQRITDDAMSQFVEKHYSLHR